MSHFGHLTALFCVGMARAQLFRMKSIVPASVDTHRLNLLLLGGSGLALGLALLAVECVRWIAPFTSVGDVDGSILRHSSDLSGWLASAGVMGLMVWTKLQVGRGIPSFR